ncbi:hypothetical protein N9R04_09115 [Staphylococcus sp. SQ8-PEA]|uniref:Staphylococcal protein n=1 Tax=Staphylococcus marylandisciuri TaxID=2981529 RepID=A0ABT2QS71_9STAP|nr:hypothetical protein [Staphylococcus marylandisciuri]MCU5746834.1 hypothetical protein [Staphylococcus marylandisciuri]
MSESNFEVKVRKYLWFLNRKEKTKLANVMNDSKSHSNDERPIYFANQFLKRYIFKEKAMNTNHFFLILIGLFASYVICVGLFLLGFLTSLSAVQHLLNPAKELSFLIVSLTFIGSLLLLVVSLFLIKRVTAFFTKKLLEYKFNKN